ncbi:MAG: protein kinase [Isosphaerales bacterium]
MSTIDRQTSEEGLSPLHGNHESPRDLTGVTLGDFHVERLLGRGGMGEVYLATQQSLNRPVALKVLLSNFSSNPTYLGRLKKEATAVAKLNHPNILHVYMLGCIDDIHFIVMEYVEGTNLRDYIVKKGALDLPLAFSIMKQAGQAIAAAGAIGLIHRDVKPENILMTRKGRVKVADFGLCRDQDTDVAHLTQSGVTMGTPLYMSPEQAQGHAVDHRSDLYSLGVTFYHMLAGEPPFRGDTALAVALKQVREAPRSMRVHRPELPVELDRLVLKLMAKSPSDRYQSAGEMLTDLTKLRDLLPIGSAATIADTSQGLPARAEESREAPAGNVAGSRGLPRSPAGLTVSGRSPGWGSFPSGGLARLSWTMVISTCLASALCGAIAGWSARSPDALAVPTEPAARLPGLWLEPRWTTVPKRPSAEDQLHYALLQAEREDWAPAFIAVPGYFPHSHEQISKAYTQLARILYRRGDLDALVALESDLSRWKEAKGYDQELSHVVHIAIKLGDADWKEVLEGFKKLTREDVPDMYDPALVELSLEICVDAVNASVRAGTESVLRQDLHQYQMHLVRQLYRIELPKSNRPLSRAAFKQS